MKLQIAFLAICTMLTLRDAGLAQSQKLQDHRERQDAQIQLRIERDQMFLQQQKSNAENRQAQAETNSLLIQQREKKKRQETQFQLKAGLDRGLAELNTDLAEMENRFRIEDELSERNAELYREQQLKMRSVRQLKLADFYRSNQGKSKEGPKIKKEIPLSQPQQNVQQRTNPKEDDLRGITLGDVFDRQNPNSDLANSLGPAVQAPSGRCKEVQDKIQDLISRDKRRFGDDKTHGLKNRFPEQDFGQHGPGSEVYVGHQEIILNLQAGLKKLLNQLPEDCDPPPGAYTWAYRELPSKETYRGPSSFLPRIDGLEEWQTTSRIDGPSNFCQTLGGVAGLATGAASCLTAGTAGGVACAPVGVLPAIPCAMLSCSSAAGISAAATGIATMKVCDFLEKEIRGRQ